MFDINKKIIFFNGIGPHKGGLCDRLKGMYSCWLLSKKLNRDFIYDLHFPVILNCKHYKNISTESFKQLNIIDFENLCHYKKILQNLEFDSNQNYTIHTNMDFSEILNMENSFSEFINTFFDIKKFETDYNIEKYDIGIHIRCGGKMVDWNDYDFGQSFDWNIFEKNILKINEMGKDVYVCSDSKIVLDKLDSLNLKDIIISPYEPKHIDRGSDISEKDYFSTFYDLITLANCKKIYYTFGEFAKTASKIYGNEIQPFYT